MSLGLSTSSKTVVAALDVMRENFDEEVLDWKNVSMIYAKTEYR